MSSNQEWTPDRYLGLGIAIPALVGLFCCGLAGLCLPKPKETDYNALLFSFEENFSPEEIKKIVESDELKLYYFVQTEEICLAAVKQNGDALKFVQCQTEKICRAAYEQTPFAKYYMRQEFGKLFPSN